MKAIVYESYGSPSVLELKEVEKPTPKADEVLLKVHAASVNYGDIPVLRGKPLQRLVGAGLLKPKHQILGDDVAGKVEAVGGNVKRFQPGDEVFGISIFGAFAEYVCADEKFLALKPKGLTYEQAAAIPFAAITALHSLSDQGQIQAGQKVLINGASGGVGSFAVQIAKAFGAEVTGVCSSSKLDLVCSIGADHVIDYTKEDFTKSGQKYDLILAVGGYHPIWDYQRALTPEGIYVCVGGTVTQYFQALLLGPMISIVGSKKMGVVMPKPNQEDYILLTELLETAKVVPVIDKCYPLSEVPEALRYFEDGHAKGKIIISMKLDNKA